jgi:hypothetical protein
MSKSIRHSLGLTRLTAEFEMTWIDPGPRSKSECAPAAVALGKRVGLPKPSRSRTSADRSVRPLQTLSPVVTIKLGDTPVITNCITEIPFTM